MIAFGAACATSVWSKTITIGILDTIDPWFYVQTFGPTMEHLRKVIPQYEIKSVELSFENLQKAIKAGELDFFIAPSGFFAYVAESAGARHIATRHPQGAKDPSKSVGSVFVVRANDSRFNTLSDLVRVSVAATDSNSFDGWIIALGELLLQNLDPKRLFSVITYTGYGIPDVASMVLNKQVDVGILKTCDLEQFEREGTIAKGALRVLNPKNDSLISCKVSTDLYPDVVFASLPKADSNLVKTVSVGLLTMDRTRGGVSFDYTTISSTDIRADITKFLHRYGSDNEPRSFEGLVECYRERPHAHLYGMERLEDALAMPQIEKSELKKLVQENVAKARNLIDDILAHYDADFVGFLNFVDWFSIGGGPSCTLPVSFETKPPISIMLGARVGNDLAILHLVKELSEIAKAAQHVEKLGNKAE